MNVVYVNVTKFINVFFLLLSLSAGVYAQNPVTLRVATHSSFALDKKLITDFEKAQNCKIELIELGDSGQMVNKLILTRQNPLADVVYGIDNVNQKKALSANLFLAYTSKTPTRYKMQEGLTAVDYGWVNINYQKSYFADGKKQLPKSLEALTKPEFENLLVLEHPASSSPGLAFFLATYEFFGEEKVWSFWKEIKANGVKITKGWSEAYQKDFSQNGGKFPMVISYQTSPAAEVFYSSKKLDSAPTASLWLDGGYFFQIEGIGIIKDSPNTELAKAFIEFMLSPKVQVDLQTQMWMNPVNNEVATVDAFKYAEVPPLLAQKTKMYDYSAEQIQNLIQKWIETMR